MKNKSKKITIDDLARMTKDGFDELGGKIDKLSEQVRAGFGNNAREHEDMKLRLDNVADRFEVVDLQKRVDVLEKKAGIKK